MNSFTDWTKCASKRLSMALAAASLTLYCTQNTNAFPTSKVTFRTDAPFAGNWGAHTLTSSDGLVTAEAWADTDATVSAVFFQWWWCFGVDSGAGNGALLDASEAITLKFDKAVGASAISFFYTGGEGGANNLTRLSISGFSADPGAVAATAGHPRISNIQYANGTLSFDYLDDGAGDYGIVMFGDPVASAGKTLKITGAISPNGDSKGWHASLYQVTTQEAYGGPQLTPTRISGSSDTVKTPDGLLTVKGFSDPDATSPVNLSTYVDECFGIAAAGNVIKPAQSLTLQFADGVGLSRLDSVYSGGTLGISGFASDPGFVDTAADAFNASYADGTLTVSAPNGGLHHVYFKDRAASAGRTLRCNVTDGQFGFGGIGYSSLQTVIGPDIAGVGDMTTSTADGLLTISAFSDHPQNSTAYIYGGGDWFGVGGGNPEVIDSTESIQLKFAGNSGLLALGTRYSSGRIVIAGFASDPGLTDPAGVASEVSYAGGTLGFAYASHASEQVLSFKNLSASLGRTLALYEDTGSGQIAVTRIVYGVELPQVSITKSGEGIVLSWPAGKLVECDTVDGTYTEVAGASSPYTVTAPETMKYYRLLVQ